MTSSGAGGHVINWSTAVIEWTPEGMELSVSLALTATTRQAFAIADELERRFEQHFRDSATSVVAVEPDDQERPQLLVTSAVLLRMNPHGLRDLMNSVADDTANQLLVVEASDSELASAWLAVLRG